MQAQLAKNVVHFAPASAKNRRVWWIYAMFEPENKARVTGKNQYVTVWVGPFTVEHEQIRWRTAFETELEARGMKAYDIRAVPTGRSHPNPDTSDIDLAWSAEEAVADLPRIIAYKTNVSKV